MASTIPSMSPQDIPANLQHRFVQNTVGAESDRARLIPAAQQAYQQSNGIGTVFNTANTGMAAQETGDSGYPTGIKSFYQWVREAVNNDNNDSSTYRDVLASSISEFCATLIYIFALNTVIAVTRADISGPPFSTTSLYLHLPVVMMAWLGIMLVHSTMWTFSVDMNPWISLVLVFTPGAFMRHGRDQRWGPAWATMFGQWVGQFIGTLLATWVAFKLENTLTPGVLDNSLRAAYPILLNGATPTKAGVLLGFAFFIYAFTYFSMTLENYRNSSAQTRSLYTGVGMGVAFLICYVQTTAVFSPFQILSSSIVGVNNLGGATRWTPWNAIAGPIAGSVTDVSTSSFWALYTVPALVASAVAYLLWFFVFRLTSSVGWIALSAPVTKSKLV